MELRGKVGFRSRLLAVDLWAGPATFLSFGGPTGEHWSLTRVSRITEMKVARQHTGRVPRVSLSGLPTPLGHLSPLTHVGDSLQLGVSLTLRYLPLNPRRAWRAC